MDNQNLKKLNRVELLRMLIDQMTENENLQFENQRLRNELEDRKIKVDRCGSIAEAALSINGVFQSAEAAAKHYLENVKSASEEADKVVNGAKQEAQVILKSARDEAERILKDANEKSEIIMSQANRDSQQIRSQAMEAWETFISGTDMTDTGDGI